METQGLLRYRVWLIAGVVLFGGSLAVGYWYATGHMVGLGGNRENNTSMPAVALAPAEVWVDDANFTDLAELETGKVVDVVEFLRGNFPAEADRGVDRIAVKRMENVLAKEEYRLFQAADESNLQRVTMGCNWEKQGREAVVELYLDRDFMKIAEVEPKLKDRTLRGVTFCVLSAITTSGLSEDRQNQMLISLYEYLGEQGWPILEGE